MEATPSQLDSLFPHPSHATRTHLSTGRIPGPVPQAGWSEESTKAVLELLKDNHQKWHIFFNEKRFHKCVLAKLHFNYDISSYLSAMLAIIC